MATPATTSSLTGRDGRSARAPAILGLGAFTVGTSELVVVGGPALTALTSRVDRRRMLLLALAAYVAANLLTAATASFGLPSQIASGGWR